MVCDWPGNVRQLCNELQRIVARAEDGTLITPQHLSREILTLPTALDAQPHESAGANANSLIHGAALHPQPAPPPGGSLSDAVESLERQMIAAALRAHRGNVTHAARALGLTRRGLQLKLARYEIDASDATT
jgi:two-component system response regulator HupR/HoxA